MTSDGLLGLLSGLRETPPDRAYGVVVGIVTNIDDPDGLGRVRVRFPWLSETDESWWARLASPMAGNGRGIQFLPEIDDEVLVAFEHGDVRRPYVLGGLWNGPDPPPEPKPLDGSGKVAKRVVRTRAGHLIRLDDTDGAEKIEIIDRTGKNSIVIDSAANTVAVSADGDITLRSANGRVVIEGTGIEINSTAQGVRLRSAAGMQLNATGGAELTGATVAIN